MANFVLIYTGGGMPESEEEQAAVMAAWGAWQTDLGDAVVNIGNPFSPVVKNIASDGTVTDGPIGTMASGYSVLEADSMETAVGMAMKCPMLQGNGQITVYETFPM